jgi:hypothetical protein
VLRHRVEVRVKQKAEIVWAEDIRETVRESQPVVPIEQGHQPDQRDDPDYTHASPGVQEQPAGLQRHREGSSHPQIKSDTLVEKRRQVIQDCGRVQEVGGFQETTGQV